LVYFRPTRLKEACAALAARRLTLLAGGTDHFAARVGDRRDEDILDLTGVTALRGIRKETHGWRIGALATWTDLLQTHLPTAFDGLKLAAREVGGVQVQNAGTIAGNLCNASPAADGVPPLLALEASVELCNSRGTRTLPLDRFILGPRKTALQPDELLSAILVSSPNAGARSHFVKLGARKYLLISIAMVSVVLTPENGKAKKVRIAIGSCSPAACRLRELEDELVGAPLNQLHTFPSAKHLSVLKPIDDVRATAEYRLDAALTLVQRALKEAAA
jgi:CO/xanthine dehydrogenase FAD-binding subunit